MLHNPDGTKNPINIQWLMRDVRRLLGRWADEQIINGEDEQLALALYRQHPAAVVFADLAPIWFVVKSSNRGDKETRCLHAEFHCGTQVALAFPAKLMPPVAVFEMRLFHALRCSVSDQLERILCGLMADGDLICFKTGESISPKDARVQHAAFEVVAKRWLQQCAERKQALPTPAKVRRDRLGLLHLTDRVMLEDWRDFHLRHATLEVVAASGSR